MATACCPLSSPAHTPTHSLAWERELTALQRAVFGQKTPQNSVVAVGVDKVESIVITAGDEVNSLRLPGRSEYPLRVDV